MVEKGLQFWIRAVYGAQRITGVSVAAEAWSVATTSVCPPPHAARIRVRKSARPRRSARLG